MIYTMDGVAFVREYGDSEFLFSGYYKYQFDYELASDTSVFVSVGGDRDDIYRAELTPCMTLRDILRNVGNEHAVAFTGDQDISLDTAEVWEEVPIWMPRSI